MAAGGIESKNKACVIGGAGFLASFLVKLLLQKGYSVNATVRDPDNQEKIAHLLALKSLGDLKIFRADLTEESSFDAPVSGCDLVFHVAAPVNFASKDPENDMIKPAIQGVTNVLRTCAKSGTVKRVVLTSSAAAVTINNDLSDTGLVMDEGNWSNVDFLYSAKPPTWGYPVSKTLAERAAWKIAEENNIDLITIIPSLISGPSLTPQIPSSGNLAMSLITGNEFLINGLKGMQMLSGSISITHVEDVCEAHIFLAEKKSASGRYICCAVNTSVLELATFLRERYLEEHRIPVDIGGLPSKAKLMISSDKLMKEGFKFKHGLEDIYDDTLAYFKAKGVLHQ
ncbi:OLC1v1021865C1 [Oldenlandia corymbosa var. corymbosa]|uniref:Dihydroflavonol 4-reductase n=1 Tax=Oldenlandia corymbosa var. corymbosa TaxID=529605 RepID=A0AAV1BYW9_OLDCO|nr:OLC1v1021865C1 [Oldenlandia corymbosa var. corymbosa]